ncbi:MAG: glycosyltransferase family 4 protein [Candidatus Sumerlaeota bacterium]|nr:glycosyltransferase family 4 protein [Candidatus Sumerlaeota bacterium]
MKILEICRSMPWHMAGGLERHAWDLARGLAAAGDEVHLLTTPPSPWRSVPPMPPGLRLHSMSTGKPSAYSARSFRAFAREAEQLDAAHPFDVIHAQGFAAFALPPRFADRLAVTIHGTLFSETPLHAPLFRQLGWKRKIAALWRAKRRLAAAPLYARMLRRARVILVDSEFTRGELLRSRPALEPKIRVAPLGIPPERIRSAPHVERAPGGPIRLLSVGRVTPAKGFQVVLQALRLMPRAPWHWRVAGTGPALEPLRRRAEALGLGDWVEFLGEVDDARLDSLYAQSDLFLYPELSYPAFGLVALEALLAGLPVLASERGAIPEVVRPDCGWLVPGGDPPALARKLKELLANPSRIAETAARCRDLALERFSFERMIALTRAALEECAKAQGSECDL